MSVLPAQIYEMKPGKHPQRQDHVLVHKMQYQKQMEHVYVLLTWRMTKQQKHALMEMPHNAMRTVLLALDPRITNVPVAQHYVNFKMVHVCA
jgi:hypothetical protein